MKIISKELGFGKWMVGKEPGNKGKKCPKYLEKIIITGKEA